MNLVEALRSIGPGIPGDSALNSVRAQAGEAVLAVLKVLAARMRSFSEEVRDDAVGQVGYNLIRRGPRGVRVGDPETDEQVKGFLAVALRRAAISGVRGANKTTSFEDLAEGLYACLLDFGRPLDLSWARAALQVAQRELRDEIVAGVAAARRGQLAQESFRSDFDRLGRLARGEEEFPALVARWIADKGGSPEQASDALHQRFKNCRKALIAAVRDPARELPRERRLALEIVIAELRLRSSDECSSCQERV